MAGSEHVAGVDEALLVRLAGLSRGGQRWLKTALQVVRSTESLRADQESPVAEAEEPSGYLSPPAPLPKRKRGAAAQGSPSLEDVISGKANLRDHLEEYPELSEELDGLADIIDMLREAGQQRRKLGRKILREEILGQPPEPDENAPEA